ncbi:MAG: TetR/AcrR family transcriptional regulator [Specibacter sp.]
MDQPAGHDAGRGRGGDVPATLRADARRNRRSIVEAAAQVFAEQGIAAPLADVAQCAGVGIATLYRRFPDRDSLISAVFEGKMAHHADLVDAALAHEDAWDGFCGYVRAVCTMQQEDHGFMNVLTMRYPPGQAAALEAHRTRALRGFTTLVRHAKAGGRLRADFSDRDMPLLLMAHAGVVEATGNAVPELAERLVAYMLDAFAAVPADRPELPKAPGASRLHAALTQPGDCGGNPAGLQLHPVEKPG